MRTTTNSVPNPQTTSYQSYPASVPLSVYRDLAEELQAALEMVNSLTLRNQQLQTENQVLQREITKAVNSVIQLQYLVNAPESTSYHPEVPTSANFNFNHEVERRISEPQKVVRTQKVTSRRSAVNSPQPKKTKVNQKPLHPEVPDYFPTNHPTYIEEEEVRYYPPKRQPQTSETNGWTLLIAILLIVITAFGAGYVVVRPLIQSHSNS
ncbi:hypothetical protein [Calothrix sp. UHCC 0171]|uniref:hypothetical protein n=1 Tax=Calothrix sp. UHCC 0171 TaxID=3110245 RepID=UPI002B1EBCB3|nr:hypothetical protein [Calothrix sp. UHCC 0171]MEA5573756.1 hypothetical protein [Calothrix sp. UHCC 0171]